MVENLTALTSIIAHFFSGLRPRSRWLVFSSLLLGLLLILAILEIISGFFFYRHLENKVSLLREMQLIANDGIASNPELYPIYQETVKELTTSRVVHALTFPAIPAIKSSVALWKFVSGASVWLLMAGFGIFGAFGEENKIAVAAVVMVVAAAFGAIGANIPTILNPWVNYLGFPLIQFAVMSFLGSRMRQAN